MQKKNFRLSEHKAYYITGILLIYRFVYSFTKKSYMYSKHQVTLRIYFHLVLIWPARLHMRNTFDLGVADTNPTVRDSRISRRSAQSRRFG